MAANRQQYQSERKQAFTVSHRGAEGFSVRDRPSRAPEKAPAPVSDVERSPAKFKSFKLATATVTPAERAASPDRAAAAGGGRGGGGGGAGSAPVKKIMFLEKVNEGNADDGSDDGGAVPPKSAAPTPTAAPASNSCCVVM